MSSNVVCPYCSHSFKNEKLMLRHQTTSKTCLHKRGIKTETEASVDDMKNRILSLNEELKNEKDKNEILLNKISKLGNIVSNMKPYLDELLDESLYKY
jgi:hypothetical protein